MVNFLPQPWAWDERQGSELPHEFLRYLSDAELDGPTLGGQVHWSIMVRPILISVGALFVCFVLLQFVDDGSEVVRNVIWLVIFYTIGWLALKYFLWYRELVFITTKRVITVTGIINRNVAMIPLSKLTDMNYTRTPMGLILGYGSFRFETAGQNQALELLGRIPHPDYSYRYVQNLLFGRGSMDVNIIDVKTDKRLNVNWRGQMRSTGRGAVLEPVDESDDWYDDE